MSGNAETKHWSSMYSDQYMFSNWFKTRRLLDYYFIFNLKFLASLPHYFTENMKIKLLGMKSLTTLCILSWPVYWSMYYVLSFCIVATLLQECYHYIWPIILNLNIMTMLCNIDLWQYKLRRTFFVTIDIQLSLFMRNLNPDRITVLMESHQKTMVIISTEGFG